MSDEDEKESKEIASLADLVGGGGASFEGDLVKMEAIKGEKGMVNAFKHLPSTFGKPGDEYVCISITRTVGKRKVLAVVNTNAMAIVKDFKLIDQGKLPLPTTFVMRQPKKAGGKEYWYFE